MRYMTSLLMLTLSLSCTAGPVEYVVDSLDDSATAVDAMPGDDVCATAAGDCTLRAAIQEANADPSDNFISFSVAGTITVDSSGSLGPLPAITQHLSIHGQDLGETYEPPSESPPVIVLDGSQLPDLVDSDGIRILSSATEAGIYHLSIVNFPSDGIVNQANDAIIWGNFIGVLPNGNAAGNGGDGIRSTGDFTRIGRFYLPFILTGESNVVSANGGDGIVLTGDTNRLFGNYVGVDPTGLEARGNGGNGITVYGNDAWFGLDDRMGSGNIISANSGHGIYIEGNSTEIFSNRIGIDRLGGSMGNTGTGIVLLGNEAQIGDEEGTDYPEFNTNYIANNAAGIQLGNDTIAANSNIVGFNQIGIPGTDQGNAGDGILVRNGTFNIINHNQILNNGWNGVNLDVQAEDSYVQDNDIGVANVGSGPVDHGNGGNGVRVVGQDHYIGGDTLEDGNVIGFNHAAGVSLVGGSGHTVVANHIGVTGSGDDIGNLASGIILQASAGDDNQIGLEGAPNIIGYNATGITLRSNFNSVEHNYVGTDTICADRGNLGAGVRVEQDAIENRLIANTVAHNGADGVTVADNADFIHILEASMFANAGQGIDLGDDGFTANDPDDPDDGPNRLMNRPAMTILGYDMPAAHLMVETSVDIATANASYPLRIDYYWYDRDLSNQGRYFIDSFMYNSPGAAVTHDLFLPAGTTGGTLRATVTDDAGGGGTSELSDEHMFGFFDIIHEGGFEDGSC